MFINFLLDYHITSIHLRFWKREPGHNYAQLLRCNETPSLQENRIVGGVPQGPHLCATSQQISKCTLGFDAALLHHDDMVGARSATRRCETARHVTVLLANRRSHKTICLSARQAHEAVLSHFLCASHVFSLEDRCMFHQRRMHYAFYLLLPRFSQNIG